MNMVYLVWNDDRTECVGFTDRRDADAAAGVRRAVESASTLAEFFRENYADEDIFEAPQKVFQVEPVQSDRP